MKNNKILILSALLLTASMTGCGGKKQPNSTSENKEDSTPISVVTPSDNSENNKPVYNGTTSLIPGTADFGTTKIGKEKQKDSIQKGTILHAWNWSMTNIKENLQEIAEAGYTAIQTSPMQPQKDYYELGDSQNNGWWKLYQPLGFSIATKDNAIGTKNQLKEVCQEAEKYGIKIIVDVVANHLAGGTSTSLNEKVKEYEPEIYNQNLITQTALTPNDNDAKSIVQGQIGEYPNLLTSSPVVQNRVASLLKEYLDCGVDGFRFDAAKHIETPSDGEYASDFWKNVLGQANSYADTLGVEHPYVYGEILNTPGTTRNFSYYTDFMNVTDNKTGDNILYNVRAENASGIASSTYASGLNANQVVIWGESHDTYANTDGTSKNVAASSVNKAYAMVVSRKDAASLYFARPNEGSLTSADTKMGAIGTNFWKSKEVVSVNKFHNYFDGTDEYLSYSEKYAYNIRYDDNECGMVLVNTGTSTDVEIDVNEKMIDGKYIDQISGKEFVVESGKLTGQMDQTGIAVLYNPDETEKIDSSIPLIESSLSSGRFDSNNQTITYNISNAKSATIKVGNGEEQNIKSKTQVSLKNFDIDQSVDIVVKATNENDVTYTKTYHYTRYEAPKQDSMQVYFIASGAAATASSINIYLWNLSSQVMEKKWPGTSMKFLETDSNGNKVYTYTIDLTKYDMIIFNTSSWQTVDFKISYTDNTYSLTGEKDSQSHYKLETSNR